jgi:hypothetical protein
MSSKSDNFEAVSAAALAEALTAINPFYFLGKQRRAARSRVELCLWTSSVTGTGTKAFLSETAGRNCQWLQVKSTAGRRTHPGKAVLRTCQTF